MNTATPATFRADLAALTARIAGRPLDAARDAWLNAEAGPATDTFRDLQSACTAGVAAGWLCPHHVPPNGEIDLVMPMGGDARFDGRPAGWVVMPPGSAHSPTVSQGRALVPYLLPYLLPEGRIDFTGAA